MITTHIKIIYLRTLISISLCHFDSSGASRASSCSRFRLKILHRWKKMWYLTHLCIVEKKTSAKRYVMYLMKVMFFALRLFLKNTNTILKTLQTNKLRNSSACCFFQSLPWTISGFGDIIFSDLSADFFKDGETYF